jgi:cellulose biosynthesis protein BcsQ
MKPNNNHKMKKLIFITQAKGGSGKSILAFLLAEKNKDAVIFDMDDATRTSLYQLEYRKPKEISFLNSNKVIDRGYFSDFLEKISEAKKNLFICDLGASVSEQLPYYINSVGIEFLSDTLEALGVKLEIYAVVAGANNFTQTMSYLDQLNKEVQKKLTLKVFKNEFFEFTADQNNQLKSYTDLNELPVSVFNITNDNNQTTQNRIREVLKSGKGVEEAPAFSKMFFNGALKNADLEIGTES